MENDFIKNAIMFDLDGTLWDALIPIKDSWNKAMKNHNLHYRFDLAKVKSFMGLTPEETAILVFNDVDLITGLKYFKFALDEEISFLKFNPGKLYENEEEVLKELSLEYPLFIVSNSDKGYIENYLQAFNFDKYFKDHICAGDTNLNKWENILYLKNKYKIKNVIYVGDTDKDRVESKKAHVEFVYASYGFGLISEKVLSIKKIQELPIIVKKVFKN